MSEETSADALALLKDETGLFCIDGDNTLIDGHTHNLIWDAISLSRLMHATQEWDAVRSKVAEKIAAKEFSQPKIEYWQKLFTFLAEENKWQRIKCDEETQWELVKDLKPIGKGPEPWKKLFHTLCEDGHAIAIVSFSSFGHHIIPRYLRETIGLEHNFVQQHICVVSFLPEDQSTKQEHIAQAKEKTGRNSLPPGKIVFCDDNNGFVWGSIRSGIKGVFADAMGEHIQVLLEKSKSLLKIESQGTPYSSPRALSSSSEEHNTPLSGFFPRKRTPSPPAPPPSTEEREKLRRSGGASTLTRSPGGNLNH